MTNRLLITGGSGFLGGNLARLARARWQVTAAFHNHPAYLDGVQWAALDLTDEAQVESLFREVAPGVVIHTAAMTKPDYCEEHPEEATAVNVHGTENLARAAALHGARFIHISTDLVFDGEQAPYREDDPTIPVSHYGRTKVLAEEVVRAHCPNHVVVRPALMYGVPVTGGSSFSQWIIHQLREGCQVPLFTDQYRTPVWVVNLAEALLELASHSFNGTIHLAGSQRVTRYGFGLLLAKALSLPAHLLQACTMDEVPSPQPRPRDVSLDVSKARTLLRTRLVGYEEGLTAMAEQMKKTDS